MPLIRSPRSVRSGVAAVEFGVVAPVLLVLLVGAWEVGRMVTVQQLMDNAAREGGRQAATGTKTASQVKDAVVRYLQVNGITKVSTSDVKVVNLTGGSDPSAATQLDRFRITVTIPFDSVRWVLVNQITSTTTLTGQAEWYSMRDIPLAVNSNIPLQ